MIHVLSFLKKIYKLQTWKVRHTGCPNIQGGGPSKGLFGQFMIRRVAIFHWCISMYYSINYAFYAEVKQAYKDDVKLASFIAMFWHQPGWLPDHQNTFTSRLLYFLGNVWPCSLPYLAFADCNAAFCKNMTDSINHDYIWVSAIVGCIAFRHQFPGIAYHDATAFHARALKGTQYCKRDMDPFATSFQGFFFFSLKSICTVYRLWALHYLFSPRRVIGIFRVHQQYLKNY